MNLELPDEQGGFRKERGTRDQTANICWIIEKNKEVPKNKIKSASLNTHWIHFDCVNHNKLWKILKETGIPDHLTSLLRIYMQVKKQQLEPDIEKWTGSKLEKEYLKAVYRKLTNLITWTTALSNSMKLRAMPCRATQDE